VRLRHGSIAMSLVGLLAMTACGTGQPAPTQSAPSEREVAVGCRADAQGGRAVHFDGVDGARLGGLVLGTGEVAVVLVHQVDETLCQWLPYGKELANRGYRVLLIDLGGYGSSEPSSTADQDVKQAVGFLRAQGARSIVLIGASLGGTASLSAGVIVRPPVTAVISLSGPVRTHGMDLSVRIRALTAPVLYIAGNHDGTFAQDAQLLYEATVEERKRLLLVDEGAHGVVLVAGQTVSAAMDRFLADYAPPTQPTNS
jgi:pimeloyl-ACP methyl ester carboxylesterase